jgi:formylglycine-generating enzyme required for sulfatase activity
MALIPAGVFRMGDITGHSNWEDEKPVHEVTITHPFLLGRTEVTQAQWREVMGNNPSNFKGDKLPVEQVSWFDAVEYFNKRSKLEGLDSCYSASGASIVCDFTKNGYRLPTEAEWEYSCRGGTETDFSTGNMRHSECNPLDESLDRAGWYCPNSDSKTHEIAQKEPNVFGLYDMHGNVWEWCWDWEDDYESVAVTNPIGSTSGIYRVLRGGSWLHLAHHCCSCFRYGGEPDGRDIEDGRYRGFRVARTF